MGPHPASLNISRAHIPKHTEGLDTYLVRESYIQEIIRKIKELYRSINSNSRRKKIFRTCTLQSLPQNLSIYFQVRDHICHFPVALCVHDTLCKLTEVPLKSQKRRLQTRGKQAIIERAFLLFWPWDSSESSFLRNIGYDKVNEVKAD